MPLTSEDATIGIVGLGNLGQAIGLNLLSKNWRIRALDNSPKRLESLVAAGAVRTNVAGLAECDALCFVVPDDKAIWEVLKGPDHLLDRLGPQHTVIVHSTILPSRAQELARRIHDGSGADFLDAPVTGGADRARGGNLTLFVGGREETLHAMQPLLSAVGSEVHHLGPVGAGSATKLANQLVMFAALSGLHEALQLASSYDVAESDLLDAISTGTADTWVGRNWGFFDRIARDYDDADVPVENRPWSKDLKEVLAAATASGLSFPFAELLSETVADTIERHARRPDRKEEVTAHELE